MAYTNLVNHYKTIFSLVNNHKYDAEWIENLIPFERDLYCDMIIQHHEEQEFQDLE